MIKIIDEEIDDFKLSNGNCTLIAYANGDVFKIKTMHGSLRNAYKYSGTVEDAIKLRDWLTEWIDSKE
jgi:hypothetical protein